LLFALSSGTTELGAMKFVSSIFEYPSDGRSRHEAENSA
jgi:hypothetical protein